MKQLPLIARYILGGAFAIFGANKFLMFLPMGDMSAFPMATDFFMALGATGYMFELIGSTEMLAGLMILTNTLPALGLIILAPVLVNILFFHLFLAPDPSACWLPVVLTLIYAYLIKVNWKKYAPLFEDK